VRGRGETFDIRRLSFSKLGERRKIEMCWQRGFCGFGKIRKVILAKNNKCTGEERNTKVRNHDRYSVDVLIRTVLIKDIIEISLLKKNQKQNGMIQSLHAF
jgi:hypothetical protein